MSPRSRQERHKEAQEALPGSPLDTSWDPLGSPGASPGHPGSPRSTQKHPLSKESTKSNVFYEVLASTSLQNLGLAAFLTPKTQPNQGTTCFPAREPRILRGFRRLVFIEFHGLPSAKPRILRGFSPCTAEKTPPKTTPQKGHPEAPPRPETYLERKRKAESEKQLLQRCASCVAAFVWWSYDKALAFFRAPVVLR